MLNSRGGFRFRFAWNLLNAMVARIELAPVRMDSSGFMAYPVACLLVALTSSFVGAGESEWGLLLLVVCVAAFALGGSWAIQSYRALYLPVALSMLPILYGLAGDGGSYAWVMGVAGASVFQTLSVRGIRVQRRVFSLSALVVFISFLFSSGIVLLSKDEVARYFEIGAGFADRG